MKLIREYSFARARKIAGSDYPAYSIQYTVEYNKDDERKLRIFEMSNLQLTALMDGTTWEIALFKDAERQEPLLIKDLTSPGGFSAVDLDPEFLRNSDVLLTNAVVRLNEMLEWLEPFSNYEKEA